MSSDQYRRKVQQHRKEIGKLQQDKAREAKKIAENNRKINSASQAVSRATSPSTLNSKLREVERHQDELARTEKKIADIENKMAGEHKKLCDAEKSLAREEMREQQERERNQQRAAKDHERRMAGIAGKLASHDVLHHEAKTAIDKLILLPKIVTVLFLAANPMDQQQLRLDEEVRAMTDMIRKAKHRDAVELTSCWAVRPGDVLQAINEHKPAIVHFSGHGTDHDHIVFQDDDGNAKLVTKDAIVQMMNACSDGIRLAFFNTCYSRNQAEAVVEHVEAAIGMKTSIGDVAARVFASQFYSAIGFGLSLNKAFEQARALLMMEGIPEEDTPELFTSAGLDPNEIVIVRPPEIEDAA
ncbi:MAG: hypothetical protein M5U22_06100 [Thermoleophilia bacterium]|nr:hypothetical protein [Thermoleophilia bacterium]